MPDYLKALEIAKKAADRASKLIRSFQKEQNFGIRYKGENDLVTDADVASQKTIMACIREAFPQDRFLVEESDAMPELSDERTWIIDPIDGTTNFAHGFPVYGVSIALWEHKKAQMGLVLEVNSGECFHAIAGHGAFLNDSPINVSNEYEAEHAMIGTGFPYNDMSLIDSYIQFFQWMLQHTQGVRRPGAASYDLCCVAAGRFDGFFEYSLNPWDVGAAALIVKEAGGVVTDWQGGEQWLFGQRILAGNPKIHTFLLKAVREHFSAEELAG